MKNGNRAQAVNEHEHELVKHHFPYSSIKHPKRDKTAFEVQPGIFGWPRPRILTFSMLRFSFQGEKGRLPILITTDTHGKRGEKLPTACYRRTGGARGLAIGVQEFKNKKKRENPSCLEESMEGVNMWLVGFWNPRVLMGLLCMSSSLPGDWSTPCWILTKGEKCDAPVALCRISSSKIHT